MSEPPAASLSESNPPVPRQELEADWAASIQAIWTKIRSTQAPTSADWEQLIKAERMNRMHWLEAESEGRGRRGTKKRMADLMSSVVGEDGSLQKPKKTRTRKSKAKGTPAPEPASE
jgi:hypothetical protein